MTHTSMKAERSAPTLPERQRGGGAEAAAASCPSGKAHARRVRNAAAVSGGKEMLECPAAPAAQACRRETRFIR